jgi:hypothetical protein
MTSRRSTLLLVILLAVAGVSHVTQQVYAAPPQFNPEYVPKSALFSPFPGFPQKFVSSITSKEYSPPTKKPRGGDFEFDFDHPDNTVTYTKRLRNDVMMIPVSSDLDTFLGRRLESSLANTRFDIGKRSLVKD